MIKNKLTDRISPKREKQTRYLSQAIQLEEAVNPHIIRATMTMVSLAILVFIVWAGFTNINEVARTPGEVVPHGYQQTVQHLEGGMVKAINVHEGDVVDEGQVLVRLNDASLKEDIERARVKQLGLEMQAERLRAFVDGREPDFSKFNQANERMVSDQRAFFEGMRTARQKEEHVIRDQIAEKRHMVLSLSNDLETARANLEIEENIYVRKVDLNKKGYTSDMQLLSHERDLNEMKGKIKSLENRKLGAEAEITEYENRLASLSATHRDEAYEKLSEVEAEQSQNIEIIQKMEERIGRLDIRAPSRGLVKGVAVNTIGAVIQPGQTIMEIVPLDKNLVVEVKISPQDIGHLKIGQPVQVKFSTFDFSRYGSVRGQLDHISATTFSGNQGERYYQGRVLLAQSHVGANPDNVIMPGMTAMADVITGRKTILQYMLKPIHISLRTAFTER